MTVDTVAKIVEEEKCWSPKSVCGVGGGGDGGVNGDSNGHGGECNGEGKEDYVFVNGSDAASSDDHGENHDNGQGEVLVAEPSVEGGDDELRNGDGGEDRVDDGVKVDGGESNGDIAREEGVGGVKVHGGESEVGDEGNARGEGEEEGEIDGSGSKDENGVELEVDSGGRVVGVELVKENGEIKVEDETSVLENCGGVSDVLEESDPQSGLSEVLNDECYSNGVAAIDAGASPSVEDLDKLNMNGVHRDFGVPQSCEVEPRDGAVGVVEVEPQALDGELAGQKGFVYPEEDEKQVNGLESFEGDVQKLELHGDNDKLHEDEVQVPEPEAVAIDVAVQNPLETKVNQSQEDGLTELQQLDVEVKSSLIESEGCESQVPGVEDDRLSLEDSISVEHSSDCKQQDLQPTDVENVRLDLIEAEAQVMGQGDLNLAVSGGSQNLEPGNTEAFARELDHGDGVETKDNVGSLLTAEAEETSESNTLPIQFQGVENQVHTETAAISEKVEEADIVNSYVQSDVTKIETSVVEETVGALVVEKQSERAVEQERVDGDKEPELRVEVGGSRDSCANEDVLPDQVPEQIASADTLDREVPLKDPSCPQKIFEDNVTGEKAHVTVVEEDENAAGAGAGVGILENEVTDCPDHDSRTVPESIESFDIAGSSLSCAPAGNVEDWPAPSDTEITNEVRAPVGASSGADNCVSTSVEDASAQMNLENNVGPLAHSVCDAKLKSKSLGAEVDVASKSNDISDNVPATEFKFGSLDCEPSISRTNIYLPTDALNKSAGPISLSNVAPESSNLKFGPVGGVTSSHLQSNDFRFPGVNHDNNEHGVVVSLEGVNNVSGSSVEEPGPGPNSCDGQVVNSDVVGGLPHYMIRIPRYDDEKHRNEIKQSEALVKEETKRRDAIRSEIQKKKAICCELKSAWEAAKSEERAVRGLMMSKKRALDTAYSVVNLARDMTTVDEISIQIRNMDRRIQHETLDLREEKKLIREIKQLKDHRDQLSSITRRQQEEVQQALSHRAQNEENLKALRKELDAIKDKHSKAVKHAEAAGKKYDEELELLEELNGQYNSANNVRQDAFAQLQNLRKQSYDKNKRFYNYKDDFNEAIGIAKAGDKDSLARYCVNQVEKIMELWNNDEEFRKEYIRCNTRRTLWRLGTLDGRAIGLEEVRSSVPNVPVDRVDALVKVKPDETVSTLQRESPVEVKSTDNKTSNEVLEQKKKAVPAKKKEATPKSSLAEASGRRDAEENEECERTKEEKQLAIKAEQSNKEKEAARLKEQRRLEEKMKAQEALERKQKRAEEAKARAEFRARKEAEEKEKKREKRARKKEKRGISSLVTEAEPSQTSKPLSEPVREPEVIEKPATVSRKAQKTKRGKALAPMPVALKQRRRSWYQRNWRLLICILLLVVAAIVFLLKH